MGSRRRCTAVFGFLAARSGSLAQTHRISCVRGLALGCRKALPRRPGGGLAAAWLRSRLASPLSSVHLIPSGRSCAVSGDVERTLAIIKPDAVGEAEAIMDELKTAGFTILKNVRVSLSGDAVRQFYDEHKEVG